MVLGRPLFLAICALACLPTAAAQPLEWGPLPEALADHRPTLVYVRAAWCGPCRQLERDTFADTEVTARMSRFALTKLTLDDHDRMHRIGPYRLSEADWAARFGAESTPTLVLLTPDGAILARHTGLLAPPFLTSILDAALDAVSP